MLNSRLLNVGRSRRQRLYDGEGHPTVREERRPIFHRARNLEVELGVGFIDSKFRREIVRQPSRRNMPTDVVDFGGDICERLADAALNSLHALARGTKQRVAVS